MLPFYLPQCWWCKSLNHPAVTPSQLKQRDTKCMTSKTLIISTSRCSGPCSIIAALLQKGINGSVCQPSANSVWFLFTLSLSNTAVALERDLQEKQNFQEGTSQSLFQFLLFCKCLEKISVTWNSCSRHMVVVKTGTFETYCLGALGCQQNLQRD